RYAFYEIGVIMEVWVTFDSNVWEIIVDENKRANADQVYTQLFELIKSKAIIPFFFEGLATIETLKKTDRKEYIANYKGAFSMSVDGEVVSASKGSDAPQLTDYLATAIPKALELGFRFTKLPRIGAPMLEIDEKYRAPDERYELGERLKRSFECLRFIESIGAGRDHLMKQLPEVEGGVIQRTKAAHNLSDKKYAKGVGEWVDGDALAANYGYGIDFFCTNDKASGAGKTSIFSEANLEQLESKYPVNVISPLGLISRLGAQNA
ncbi:hypothetical protein, partial [Vibrio vulnificus]|uniref:hypothetical protein n=2 Tax=Vibrionaceae TaxID=641 RepID=UPI003562E12B